MNPFTAREYKTIARALMAQASNVIAAAKEAPFERQTRVLVEAREAAQRLRLLASRAFHLGRTTEKERTSTN